MISIIQMAYHVKKSVSKGVYHDLEIIYQQINDLYFSNQIDAQITWGRFGTYTPRKRSIRLGSYCSKKKRILIHPAMDQACVPRICIERVIHHEMLHQKIPTYKHPSGRRSMHGPVFRAAEKEFKDAGFADAWFKENLKRLLS